MKRKSPLQAVAAMRRFAPARSDSQDWRRPLPRSGARFPAPGPPVPAAPAARSRPARRRRRTATDSPRGSPISSSRQRPRRGVDDLAGEEIDFDHAIGIDGAEAALAAVGDAAGVQMRHGAVGEAHLGGDFVGMRAILRSVPRARHVGHLARAPACAPDRDRGSSDPARRETSSPRPVQGPWRQHWISSGAHPGRAGRCGRKRSAPDGRR